MTDPRETPVQRAERIAAMERAAWARHPLDVLNLLHGELNDAWARAEQAETRCAELEAALEDVAHMLPRRVRASLRDLLATTQRPSLAETLGPAVVESLLSPRERGESGIMDACRPSPPR